jgi:hypothetical protein
MRRPRERSEPPAPGVPGFVGVPRAAMPPTQRPAQPTNRGRTSIDQELASLDEDDPLSKAMQSVTSPPPPQRRPGRSHDAHGTFGIARTQASTP